MSVHISEVHSDVTAEAGLPAAPPGTDPARNAQLAEHVRGEIQRARELTARLAAEAFDD
ncbi:hypothetical protein BJ973_008847 [Actinoplanes tereljensis]|uniref:Uncharacterized protein n=1 Tax=Paractinoplanes tereljensis TaxID=571912 RepID=A0A919NGJ6_9ACTN|nr:hypothetical protein [Actinoplanes tereljensis]GIF18190.1 hypothetical protein Ate02nite_09200 [Actinoplanes tereljensis]